MDDWQHVKTIHIHNYQKNLEILHKYQQINCNNNNHCIILHRYQRDREREIYTLNEEIDHKNRILMDQMDSIHAYIFHPFLSRSNILQNQYLLTMNDSDSENKQEFIFHHALTNKPRSVSECNVSQIVYIIDNIIDLDKLVSMKDEIIKFIKQNGLDGNKLKTMSRKMFMKDAATHFGDKKLTVAFGKFYNCIIKCDMKIFREDSNDTKDDTFAGDKKHIDIWYTKPKTISECNVDQIIFILNQNIMENIDFPNTKSHKFDVIKCIKENNFNGEEIVNKRKVFIAKMREYLKDKKLVGKIAKLHKQIVNYDLSPFVNVSVQRKEVVEPTTINNKFVTTNSDSKNYSFGTQYRYTPNLWHHPLYIKP
eukprot:106108_1